MQRSLLPYYFLVLFLISGQLFSFNSPQDSSAISQIDLILNKSSELLNMNIDSSMALAYEGLKLSEKVDYKKGCQVAYHVIGTNYLLNAENDSALFYLNKAVEYSKFINDKNAEANAYNNIGNTYDEIDDFDNAITFYNKALNIYKELNDSSGVAAYYVNISIVYERLNDYKTSLVYLIQADEIAMKIKDYSTEGIIKDNIAGKFIDSKNYDKAVYYLEEAIKIFRKINDFEDLAFTYSLYGYLYKMKKEFEKSAVYLDSSYFYYSFCNNDYKRALITIQQAEPGIELKKFDMAEDLLNSALKCRLLMSEDKANVYYLFGRIEYLKSNYSKSKTYLKKSLTFKFAPNELELPRDIYKLLYEIEKKRNNYKKALDLFEVYYHYKDSVIILNAKKEVYNYETVRKLKIKEKELANLQREKRIKQLELDNQRLVKNFFIGSSFLLLLVFLFGAYQFRKIHRLNQSLKKFNAQKEKFLRIISHDIKNSLGAVLNFSELIMTNIDYLSKEELVISIKEINRAATATNNLLTNLLEWSLTLNNEKEFISGKVNLQELVNEGVSSSVSSRLIKNIKCVVDIPEDINVIADRNSIISVIRNLCTNAIKFSHENSTINLYVKKTDGFAEVTVEDEGVGIPEEDLKNLFSKKAKKSTRGTMNEKGTGLGLSLVETFVKNNGGEIRAESEPGKGSKFIFTIPLA